MNQIVSYIFLIIHISAGKFTIGTPNENLDLDDYYCKAENSMGAVLSNPAKVMFGCKCTRHFHVNCQYEHEHFNCFWWLEYAQTL